MPPTKTRAARALVAIATVAGMLLTVAVAPRVAVAQSDDGVQPARVAGETRYDTAAEIARLTFTSAATAHIVSGDDFPDALSGSYAAGRMNGPLLLVQRDAVPQATWQALEDLGVERTVVIGGTVAVSAAVEAELAAAGYETDRIFGTDRYETASAVAIRYGSGDAANVGTLDGDRTAIVTSGEDFPDALSAGPLSVAHRFPLLLTQQHRSDDSLNAALRDLDIDRVIVVGGEDAVSTGVADAFRAQGLFVERVAGPTRTATAARVGDFAVERLAWSVDLALISRGDDFADALAASPHGGTTTSPILLAPTPNELGEPARLWLAAACPGIEAVRALGGREAVSEEVLSDAVDAAESCGTSDPFQDYLVAPQEALTVDPGTVREFRISARVGGTFTGPVDVALFPCSSATATDSPVIFDDADADGRADRVGETDTNSALIVSENGRPVNAPIVRDVGPAEDGVLRIEVGSDQSDCAVPVVWDDINADGHLNVDAQGQAVEDFGVGQIRWR